MATFLGGSEQVFGRKKIGYIRLGEPRWPEMSSDSFFPELPPRPTIMLMDSQLKSGKGVNVALKRIHERYDHPLVYFAVFGAMTEEPDLIIESLDDLVAAERLKDPEATKQLEDLVPAKQLKGLETAWKFKDIFIAATMHDPGIKLPWRLR